jgi:hypothetical protein
MQKRSRWDLFWPSGSDRNAHIHGRAFVQLKKELHCRAHEEIQTRMPPEPYDRKPFGLYPYCSTELYSEQDTEKFCPQPISARFDFCREAEKRPEGTFSHVSADSTSPRDALLAVRSNLTEITSCGLCHRGQRSCEATPGECSAFSIGHLRGGPAARAGPPRCRPHRAFQWNPKGAAFRSRLRAARKGHLMRL